MADSFDLFNGIYNYNTKSFDTIQKMKILLLLFHMDYPYTRWLLAAFHLSHFSLGTDVASVIELHSSSFFPSSSYVFV